MLADVGFVAILGWIAAGLGARLLSLLRARPIRPAQALAQSIPLGLGAISLSVLVLGLLGRLDRHHLIGLLGVATSVAIVPGTRLLNGAFRATSASTWRILRRGPALDRTLLGLLLAGLVGSGLAASIPVTDGDALCYHLQVPKVFLANRAITFEPDLHETVYPLVTELLDAVALEFRGPVACRWVQFLLGLVFALNVALLAGPILGGRSWWAGAIALLVPGISNGMIAPLNDVALAAFGTAAIAATMRTLDRPSIHSAALAGCSMGLALGVKYPAIVLFGLLVSTIAASSLFSEGRSLGLDFRVSARMTLAFAGSAIMVGGCWYLRAFVHTGNPVFPYFRQVFGGAGLDEVLDPTRRAMAVTPWNILTAIVPMTLSPDRFESFAHQFGPVFLLFIPAIAFERPPRRMLLLLAIGYSFLMICVTQRQSMRFVLTALGPLAVGAAYQLRVWSLRKSIPARLVLAIFVLSLGMESVQAMARCRNGLGVILGRESAEHYLSTREPTFRVGRWIDENLPGNARVIGQDHRGYYLPRPYTMELAHRRRTGLCRRGESAPAIVDHLRRSGFTHLLLCPPSREGAVEFDPTLGRLLEPWMRDREPVFREDLGDADGVVRRYAIFALDSQEKIASTAAAGTNSQVTR